ncbi:MAG: hypothetical protein ACK6CT_00375 [Planctomycetia bacterium]|jgi:hypothetical protein
MNYSITFRTPLARGMLEERLRRLTADGPFHVPTLSHHGGGAWTAVLRPARPDMVIGFAKVAELLVLLTREFDVSAVQPLAAPPLAAAS